MLLVVPTVTLVYGIGAASGSCQAKPLKVNAVLPSFVRVSVFDEVVVDELSTIPPKSTVWKSLTRYPVEATTFPLTGIEYWVTGPVPTV